MIKTAQGPKSSHQKGMNTNWSSTACGSQPNHRSHYYRVQIELSKSIASPSVMYKKDFVVTFWLCGMHCRIRSKWNLSLRQGWDIIFNQYEIMREVMDSNPFWWKWWRGRGLQHKRTGLCNWNFSLGGAGNGNYQALHIAENMAGPECILIK